jgi:hypothetical protein
MEYCKICGSEKMICKECGAELHKKFHDFILRAEIIYAIFMAWGFASAAEAVIKDNDWGSLPLMLIITFVLIRFFFAPTRNLYSAALVSEKAIRLRPIVFLFDFPMLIFHSFAYYTMCLALKNATDNAYGFFQWFIILLTLNVAWLVSIAFRMSVFGREKHYWTFIKWSVNNFVTVLLFLFAFKAFSGTFTPFLRIFFTKDTPFLIREGSVIYVVFSLIAILNCCADVILTASDYLGFED